MSDLTRLYDLAHEWQYRALASEGREKVAHATIADLRDRLRLIRRYLCRDCGCTTVRIGDTRCEDCGKAGLLTNWTPSDASRGPYAAACISVGLRAICGRRILEGVE